MMWGQTATSRVRAAVKHVDFPNQVPSSRDVPKAEVQAEPVLFLKLVWRGIRDLFEQFLSLTWFSLLWWVCFILIVPGPPATVALYSMADPRRQVSTPDFRDAVDVFWSAFRRSWGIFLFTVPLMAVLVWNLYFFGGTTQLLAAMTPLWMIMLVLIWVLMLYAYAVAGTMESGVRNAFRGAVFVLVSRPLLSIVLSLFSIILIVVMTITVLPMVLFGPALIASIVNRVVLFVLGVEVIDPSAPTTERADERARGINPDRGWIGRLRAGTDRNRR